MVSLFQKFNKRFSFRIAIAIKNHIIYIVVVKQEIMFCRKKTFKNFDCIPATLDDVTAHIAQIEKGTKIWNELLLPLKKSKNSEGKEEKSSTAI